MSLNSGSKKTITGNRFDDLLEVNFISAEDFIKRQTAE
jgi:hypothetical protein